MNGLRGEVRLKIVDVVEDATADFGILRPFLPATPDFKRVGLNAEELGRFNGGEFLCGHGNLLFVVLGQTRSSLRFPNTALSNRIKFLPLEEAEENLAFLAVTDFGLYFFQ
nr:hypothetical protein [uncultured Fibrobacter sp.]